MPSVCSSIKLEYEALKTITQEFVSACEKAGDPRALSADQLRTLQIQKQKLEKARDELRDKIGVSPEVASEILDEDFYNEKDIEKTFGFSVSPAEIPRIPYSRKTLEQAKANGEALILRVAYDGDRTPMTMQRMHELLSTHMAAVSWALLNEESARNFKREPFFNDQPLVTEWKIVSRLDTVRHEVDNIFVGQTMIGDYIQRTMMAREYLRSVGALSKEEEEDCSDAVLQHICKQMGVSWSEKMIEDIGAYDLYKEEGARRLVSMKVNANHGCTLAEIFYDHALLGQHIRTATEVVRLEGAISNTLSSDGRIVCLFRHSSGGMTIQTVEPCTLVMDKALVVQR